MNDLSKVSVVLPSLDPDEKLHLVIEGLLEYGFSDIILVNDGSKPENRIHLMVSGHVHDFIYAPAGGDLWCYKPGEKITKAGDWRTGKGFPYPVIVMDGPGYGGEDASVLDLRLDDTGIKAHVRSVSGVDLLKFHIKGDGTVVQEERSELLTKKEKFIK